MLKAMIGVALLAATPAAAQDSYRSDLQGVASQSRVWWAKSRDGGGPVDPVSAPIKRFLFEDQCSMYIAFDDSVPGIPFSSGINLYFNNVDSIDTDGTMIEFELKDPSFMRNWHWGIEVPADQVSRTMTAIRGVFSACGVDFE